jgi:hypothetical protein
MTPQSNFMVVAPIRAGGAAALKKLLGSMNERPGFADPDNAVVPFGQFDKLHFARFVILDDHSTLADLKGFVDEVPQHDPVLAFLGDCDGPADDFLAELAQHPTAKKGLRRIFGHCEGFANRSNLLTRMQERERRPAAAYVNWRGRTVRQVHEDAKLRAALVEYVDRHAGALAGAPPRQIQADLVGHVDRLLKAGELTLTPPAPTPLRWWLKNAWHFLGPLVVVAALVCAITVALWFYPFLLLPLIAVMIAALLLFVALLRYYEISEPEIIPPLDHRHARALAAIEDHDVTNQFTVLGSVKPSWFRRALLRVVLCAIDYAARHFYTRGFLSRVQTIVFARWAFVDDDRVIFASNYDGSLEAYMDDFINKVGWGLNLAFAAGVGYPRTNWLVKQGSKEEQKFKSTLRRHELATEVWYKAYPGLTAFDLARNARVREGYNKVKMSDAEIRGWLREL